MIYLPNRLDFGPLDTALRQFEETVAGIVADTEAPVAIGQREIDRLGGAQEDGKEVLALTVGRGVRGKAPRPFSTEGVK